MPRILILGVTVALFVIGVTAQTISTTGLDKAPTSVKGNPCGGTGFDYLRALYYQEFDELKKLMDPEINFSDPTSILMSRKAWEYNGRESVLAFFKSASAGSSGKFHLVHCFVSGKYHVFSVIYKTEGDGKVFGLGPGKVEFSIPGTTILKVHNSLVVEHQDYVDYERLLREIERKKRRNKEIERLKKIGIPVDN